MHVAGDIATVRGTNYHTGADGVKMEAGPYMTLWKRQPNGDWKVASCINGQ